MNDRTAMFTPLTEEELAAGKDEAARAKDRPAKCPIVPVPDDAPALSFQHPKHGAPSKAWPYHDAEGRILGYVARWDFTTPEGTDDKGILPVTFCDLGNGRRGWRAAGIPAPRPLFGLPNILARSDARILVTEGEKTRDAAAVLFPDFVVTTPAHGAMSPAKTNWDTVAGRVVVIATDHDGPDREDTPGRDFGDAVAALCREAGAVEVLHLRPETLGHRANVGAGLPDGWDLADALEDGWTPALIEEARRELEFFVPYEIEESDDARPPDFTDEALALAFADQHERDLRYVDAWSRWFAWDSVRWEPDETLAAFDRARAVCRVASAEAKKTTIKTRLASAKTVAAVERLAKADRRIAAQVDQWDADTNSFNTTWRRTP